MLPYEILFGFRNNFCNRLLLKHVQNSSILQARKFTRRNVGLLQKKNIKTVFLNIQKKNSCETVRYYCQVDLKNNDREQSDREVPSEVKHDDYHLKTNIKESLSNAITPSYIQNMKDGKKTETTIQYVPESVRQWLFSSSEKIPDKEISRKFPEPKLVVHNLYNVVAIEKKMDKPVVFGATKVTLPKKKHAWSSSYNVKWPCEMTFTAVASSKIESSKIAALKLLHWLDIEGRINRNKMPILYDKTEKDSILHSSEKFEVDPDILLKVNNFLETHENDIRTMIDTSIPPEPEENIVSEGYHRHPISNLLVDAVNRNEYLFHKLGNRKPIGYELPIFDFRNEIIAEIEKNQALVIKGDTGCGKTTQVPQFIMDHLTELGKASDCNMIVTQPRRISAISLAERVAQERGESVGDVVGYQVRLQQVLPKHPAAILFCTTGVLLKKLQSNPTLEEISHVIIDEAHERNIDTDMLLSLLKRALGKNPQLKVIIMSATINAELFQEYLSCKAIDIPGRLFPVKMHFAEQIESLGIYKKSFNVPDEFGGGPRVDYQQVAELIKWIDENKPQGAILVFLPGWNEIQKVHYYLENYGGFSNQIVVPVHSKIPYISQSKMFEPAPYGKRKIILATDIAETGITVPDVVYVVDSAVRKEVRWHEGRGLSSIDTHWISKANLKQRKGRAGRVTAGESFHLIEEKAYEKLPSYPVPEVLRMSLEKTVLDCKIHSSEKAEEFLGSMPQPPRLAAVQKAVNDLQNLGALDTDENLTGLGKRIALFTIHPKLSKAMVYGTIFQCLSPVTTVASALSLDNSIFFGALTNKQRNRQTLKHFHPHSDHLATAWIYAEWLSNFEKSFNSAYSFCRKHGLHVDRINILNKIRDINLEHLVETGMIRDARNASDLESSENEFAELDELVSGVLLAGMDQILQHRNFEIRKGRISRSDKGSMVTEDDVRAQLTTDSVNHRRTQWPSPYLTYYQKTHHQEMRTILIRESSMLTAVSTLLFSQGRVTGTKYNKTNETDKEDDLVLLKIDGKKNVRLLCDKSTAQSLLRFRDLMWTIVNYFVVHNAPHGEQEIAEYKEEKSMVGYKAEMLKILAQLLNSSADIFYKYDEKESVDDSDNF